MALIICPECEGKVSSQSKACIHCGLPMSKVNPDLDPSPSVPPPELANDLTLKGYFYKNYVKLTFLEDLNIDVKCPTCAAVLETQKNGVRLTIKKENRGTREIHFSQITRFEIIDSSHIAKEDKSLLGRALVGGVLLGGVGAIVGGMTGFGSKSKAYDFALRISYYCPESSSFINITLVGSKSAQKDVAKTIKDCVENFTID